jgi:hypothetical protein
VKTPCSCGYSVRARADLCWGFSCGHVPLKNIESIVLAIQDGSAVERKDDRIYIDLFHIPPLFYDEVIKDERP